MKNITCAIEEAAAEIPLKPNIPAIKEIIKKITTHFNISVSLKNQL